MYLLSVFRRMYENRLGRKVLFLAWWIHKMGLEDRDVKNLAIAFRQNAKSINTFIRHLSKGVGNLRPFGCLTKGLMMIAPGIERKEKEMLAEDDRKQKNKSSADASVAAAADNQSMTSALAQPQTQ